MNIEKCRCCDREQYKKWDPTEWRSRFWHTSKDSVDLQRCSSCGELYQLSWCQILAYFILFSILVVLFFLISRVPLVGPLLAIGFAVLEYPVCFEIPRRYLPWKDTDNDLFYVRWKSKWGFILAHYFGLYFGVFIFFTLVS